MSIQYLLYLGINRLPMMFLIDTHRNTVTYAVGVIDVETLHVGIDIIQKISPTT